MHSSFCDILRAVAPTVIPEDLYLECHVGWFPILYHTCVKLEALNQGKPENEQVIALQIKEKFGGLRFYLVLSTPEAEAVIDEAEAACWKTCEICGEPGTQCGKRWIQTLCNSHAR